MQELLVLCHRIPYPPDKGDKIRSWNFIRHLAERWRLHLGCFIDDERDWDFADAVRGICGECCFVGLNPRIARLRSLPALLYGRPLTVPYFHDATLARWVRTMLRRKTLDRIFVYCSAMAHYVPTEVRRSVKCITDLVDIDSEKWIEYARAARWAKAWLWRREGVKLRLVEREIAESFHSTIVSTTAERDLLVGIAPEAAQRITAIANGVDSDYFSPDRAYDVPPEMQGTPLVFTGAMDYRPNIDAAAFFALEVMPNLRSRLPDARFVIVGANPAPSVRALADRRQIFVTGRVPDVRPYVRHAKAVVAPLRIARGVQNKVLEGMSMAKTVIASPQALVGIGAEVGTEILVAEAPIAFADAVERVVRSQPVDAIGRRARQRVIADHSWPASLARLDALFDG